MLLRGGQSMQATRQNPISNICHEKLRLFCYRDKKELNHPNQFARTGYPEVSKAQLEAQSSTSVETLWKLRCVLKSSKFVVI